MVEYLENICVPDNEDIEELHTFMTGRGHVDTKRPSQPMFAFFGDEGTMYKYFGETMVGFPFPKLLTHLAHLAHARFAGTIFNAAFVNLYRSGQDCVTPHRDKTHGHAPILSFSFYEPGSTPDEYRHLCIQDDSGTVTQMCMAHGSLVIMPGGDWQSKHLHWVPKSHSNKWRINVTLRVHDDLS